MKDTTLFRFPFDLATRPEGADDLVVSATYSEYNIDAILALTPIRIAKELSLMKKELQLHPFVDLHYELFMYCLCNPVAFNDVMKARNIDEKHRTRLFKKYDRNCQLMLLCYLDNVADM